MTSPLGLKEHVSLGEYLAFGLSAQARYFVEVKTTAELVEAVAFARSRKLPYTTAGSGYSLLFADTYPGLVIKNSCRKFDIVGKRGKFMHGRLVVETALLSVESGALVNQVVRYVVEEGLAGFEYQLGLPGTVGGALMTEFAAPYGKNISHALVSVRYIDDTGEIAEMSKGDFLKKRETGQQMTLLSGIFSLIPEDKRQLWEKGTQESDMRSKKYPPETIIGEVFSPIPLSEALSLPTPANTQEMHILLEESGLLGKQIGGVKVLETYGNTIVSAGDVNIADVLELIDYMQQEVRRKFGITPSLRLKIFTL